MFREGLILGVHALNRIGDPCENAGDQSDRQTDLGEVQRLQKAAQREERGLQGAE